MLDRVKARALGKRPARENALGGIVEQQLVDLDEGGSLRRFGRRICVAGSGRDPERAEGHRLPHLDLERGNAARNFVEGGKHRNRI
jgi:hypothetical protein